MINEITLFGYIGGWEADPADVRAMVAEADRNQPLNVCIHSEGGDVLAGEAILTALKRHPGGYNAIVEGMAFSMAANIALQANRLIMPPDGWLMFHFARWGGGGTARELEKRIQVLRTMDEAILGKLASRLGKASPGRETLEARLEADWWIDGNEALEIGIADELSAEAALAACVTSEDLPAGTSAPSACLEYLDSARPNNKTGFKPLDPSRKTSHEKLTFFARNRR